MKLAGRPLLCRLVQLDRMIRSGGYPNARSAARGLEVSMRTVKRDFDLLRDSWGAPLEFSRPHNGYYYRDKDFTLPLLRLSEGELLAFYLCAHLLPALRGTPYERALQHAFDKLTLALPAEVSVLPERLDESVAIVPAAVTPQDAKIFDTLCRAVGERRRVDLDYWTASRD